jgi:hypothetical protein
MVDALQRLVFPPEPRRLPGRRAIKILLRAIHVPCAGILSAAYLFDAGASAGSVWMVGTVVSGLLILLLDLYETGVFLLQVRGLVVLGKIALLAMLPLFEAYRVPVLVGLLGISVLSSHAPSGIRYYLLFGGDRFKGATTKG